MRNHKYRYIKFHFYEYKCIETYLETMAREGWMMTGRISLFGSVLCFKREEPKPYKFHVAYQPQSVKLLGSVDKAKNQAYIDFVESYGYTYVCGDAQIVIFKNENEDAMDIIAQDEVGKKAIRIFTYMDVLSPLYCILLFVLYDQMFVAKSSWVTMNMGAIILLILFLMGLLVCSMSAIEAIAYGITKRIPRLSTIHKRSCILRSIYVIFDVLMLCALSMHGILYGVIFLFVEFIIACLGVYLLHVKRMKYEWMHVIILFMAAFCICLLFATTTKERMSSNYIPFYVQDLQGINKQCNKAIMDVTNHVFTQEYEISQFNYNDKNGRRYGDDDNFSYYVFVVKYPFMEGHVQQAFINELNAKKENTIDGMDVYDAGGLQLLMMEDRILVLLDDVPITTENIKQFEKIDKLDEKETRGQFYEDKE